jgi:pimeloyl-ACP methyl ester carboxylesterase
VFNAMEAFKDDFCCITMDRCAMDHLGIQKFFYMGYCIGGPFGLKLVERAPDWVVAAVLCQPVGHRPENADVMYNSGRDVWAPELRAFLRSHQPVTAGR